MAILVEAQQPLPSSYESVAVSSAAVGLTAGKYQSQVTGSSSGATVSTRQAKKALLTVEGDQVRWTCDGTTPTVAIGHRANVDDVISLEGFDAIRLFKAIRITTDASLKVTYFGG